MLGPGLYDVLFKQECSGLVVWKRNMLSHVSCVKKLKTSCCHVFLCTITVLSPRPSGMRMMKLPRDFSG